MTEGPDFMPGCDLPRRKPPEAPPSTGSEAARSAWQQGWRPSKKPDYYVTGEDRTSADNDATEPVDMTALAEDFVQTAEWPVDASPNSESDFGGLDALIEDAERSRRNMRRTLGACGVALVFAAVAGWVATHIDDLPWSSDRVVTDSGSSTAVPRTSSRPSHTSLFRTTTTGAPATTTPKTTVTTRTTTTALPPTSLPGNAAPSSVDTEATVDTSPLSSAPNPTVEPTTPTSRPTTSTTRRPVWTWPTSTTTGEMLPPGPGGVTTTTLSVTTLPPGTHMSSPGTGPVW